MLFLHGFDDEIRFRMFIDRGVVFEMRTGIVLRPQTLRRSVRIVLDDRIRRIQDRLRRAIVLLELDELRLRIVLLEIHDIPKIRSTPGINALVRITDRTDILRLPCDVLCHQVLCMVRILIFVDQDIVESVLPALADRLDGEQLRRDI